MVNSWLHVKNIKKNPMLFLEAQILFLVDHVDKEVSGNRKNLFHSIILCSKSCTYLDAILY